METMVNKLKDLGFIYKPGKYCEPDEFEYKAERIRDATYFIWITKFYGGRLKISIGKQPHETGIEGHPRIIVFNGFVSDYPVQINDLDIILKSSGAYQYMQISNNLLLRHETEH